MLKSPWWIVFGAVLGLIVGNGPIIQFAYGVFLKPLTEEFHSDRGTMSSAILFNFIAAAFTPPILGRLVDRYGIRIVSLPLVVLFAGAVALLGIVPTSASTFIAMYAATGVLSAVQSPLPYAKAVTAAFDARRGLALGIAMAGVGLGTAIVPKLAQALIDGFGWRNAYLGLAGLILALAVPGLLLIGEPARKPAAHHDDGTASAEGLTARQAMATWSFWALFVAFFVLATATSGILAHIVAMLADRGVPASTAASALAAAGVALIVARLLVGWLLDHVFAPWVGLAFVTTTLVGLAMLYDVASPVQAAIAAILVGLGLGAEIDMIGFMISRYLGTRAFGEIYGYQIGGFFIASGVGPFLMGVSQARTGSYGTAIVGYGIALALAGLLLLTLGPYPYRAKRVETV